MRVVSKNGIMSFDCFWQIDPKELIEDFKKTGTGSLFEPKQNMSSTFPKVMSSSV